MWLLETSGWTRKQEIRLVPLTPSIHAVKNTRHFASPLPSPINPIIFLCFISPHVLNPWNQIPIGKNFIFLHHPVKNFCFQFLSSILNYFAAFYLALSLSPISCVSRMLSFSGSCFFNGFVVSVGFFWFCFFVVVLQPPKAMYFLSPSLASFPLPHYKQKHLQCAAENNTGLAREWTEWPNV